MERWRTRSLLPTILDALCLAEADPPVRRLADAFGGNPVATRERFVSEPARLVRRLLFASGGEIILQDDTVAAVILHLTPTPSVARGLDLADWIADVTNRATLDEVTEALGLPFHFAGMSTPYFAIDGGYARLEFKDGRGWKEPGNLVKVVVTPFKPGLACDPEDDDCPACSELLVRKTPDGVDVDATVEALSTAVSAGLLTENANWVKLTDLRPLHASRLMKRVESQLTCKSCRRNICLTLYRDAPAAFDYYVLNDAMRRPLEPIPPVEQWGDESRVAQAREQMQYVDHRRGAWFLVRHRDDLYLDARYSYSAMIDDSALIRLDKSEREAYLAAGHDYLSELATRIHNSAPYKKDSSFYKRDLYRGPAGKKYRSDVSAAIVNHTWLAEQRGRG